MFKANQTIILKTQNTYHLFETLFFRAGEMKSILKMFSEHGTFIQPDALDYISNKEKPDDFASFLIKNLKEYPLFLTVENIKNVEETTKPLEDSTWMEFHHHKEGYLRSKLLLI